MRAAWILALLEGIIRVRRWSSRWVGPQSVRHRAVPRRRRKGAPHPGASPHLGHARGLNRPAVNLQQPVSHTVRIMHARRQHDESHPSRCIPNRGAVKRQRQLSNGLRSTQKERIELRGQVNQPSGPGQLGYGPLQLPPRLQCRQRERIRTRENHHRSFGQHRWNPGDIA